MAITPLPLPQPGDTNWAGPLNASLEQLNQDVGEISETGQDILDAAGVAQQSATDAEAAAERAEDAVVEATEQLPSQVSTEVALQVPPAVDSAISSADIPGQVAIALAAQAGKIVQGVGMPNGVVTATPGTLYVDTANTNGASVWRKASGTGASGWVATEGDTGWRALCRWEGGAVTEGVAPTQMVPFGNASGGVFLRRVNSTVSLSVVEGQASNANPEITPTPSGFRGNTGMPYPTVPIYYRKSDGTEWIGNVDVGSNIYRFRVPADAILASIGTGGYGVQCSWITANAWPTSLPGNPA